MVGDFTWLLKLDICNLLCYQLYISIIKARFLRENGEYINDNKTVKRRTRIIRTYKSTKNALNNLSELKPEERDKERIHDDKLYNLYICEHRDGSGKRGNLARYDGNAALMEIVVNELTRQLADYEEKLAIL
jgi:hypothetical protein